MTTLADRIRTILGETGWSQRRLCREAGLPSQSHVALILTGRIGEEGVTADTLSKIARAADVSLDWLKSGAGPMRGAGAGTRWDEHPEWAAAVAQAKREFPDVVPPFAYDQAGQEVRRVRAAHITPANALQLAHVWIQTASEDERAAATTAWARELAITSAASQSDKPRAAGR